MTGTKLPVLQTALASWRDGLTALKSMPVIAAVIFIVMVADTTIDDALRLAATPETVVTLQLVRLVISVLLLSVILAPAAIAINRYVLLGEDTQGYPLDPSSRRLRLFCAYSVLLNILILLPMMSAEVTMDLTMAVVVIVLALIAVAALTSTWILFPAIAVDAPGANFRNAVKDTHFFQALAISIVTFLPVLAAGIAIAIQWHDAPGAFGLEWMLYVICIAAVSGFAFAVFCAMSSHLYRAWAVRLLQPTGSVI